MVMPGWNEFDCQYENLSIWYATSKQVQGYYCVLSSLMIQWVMVLNQGINPKKTTQNPWLIPACFIPSNSTRLFFSFALSTHLFLVHNASGPRAVGAMLAGRVLPN